MSETKDQRVNYSHVVWEITRQLQEADSLESALQTSLNMVVKTIGAEAGSIWFYNKGDDERIYPFFRIGGAFAACSKQVKPPATQLLRGEVPVAGQPLEPHKREQQLTRRR